MRSGMTYARADVCRRLDTRFGVHAFDAPHLIISRAIDDSGRTRAEIIGFAFPEPARQ